MPRCALLLSVVGTPNKGYTVQPSARASPQFFQLNKLKLTSRCLRHTPPLLDCGLRCSGALRFSLRSTSYNSNFTESPSARDISQIQFSAMFRKILWVASKFCSTRKIELRKVATLYAIAHLLSEFPAGLHAVASLNGIKRNFPLFLE